MTFPRHLWWWRLGPGWPSRARTGDVRAHLDLLVGGVDGLLAWLRLRRLKENPPDPELQHKPVWRP